MTITEETVMTGGCPHLQLDSWNMVLRTSNSMPNIQRSLISVYEYCIKMNQNIDSN
ncbi:unnamed protein product [Brassica rapa subsp. trilocularis]